MQGRWGAEGTLDLRQLRCRGYKATWEVWASVQAQGEGEAQAQRRGVERGVPRGLALPCDCGQRAWSWDQFPSWG